MGCPGVDMKKVEQLQRELDRPKSREYLMGLWKPIFARTQERFGDLILDAKEIPSPDGSGDITFEVLVKDRSLDILDFLAGETWEVLVHQGAAIHTLVHTADGSGSKGGSVDHS